MRIRCLDERKDFYCLRSNWFKFHEFREDGELEYVLVGDRPVLKDGEVMGYHCVIEDGKFIRYFLVLSEEEAKDRKYQVPRIFSKLKAVSVLMREGLWAPCKEYIESSGLYDLYLAAQEFSESNEYFVQGLELIKAHLCLSDEKVESLLEEMVK